MSTAPEPLPVRRLLLAAACAVVILYAPVLIRPALLFDDYDILVRSWTWDETRASIWVPQNEHAMPLGRLTTWLLVWLSPNFQTLAYLCALQGVLAVIVALPLVYLFVRREVGLPVVGVAAALVFGVTSVYQQAATWFAASFSVLALDTFLVALLAAQAWRQTGRGLYLDVCLLACALAPGWFAIGILAGPLCFLYLLYPASERPRFVRASLAPLLGTALFLAVALPQVASTILTLKHYQGRTALEAFDPRVGLVYSARSLIDNLLLGQLGLTHVCTPLWLVVPILLIVGAGLTWLLRPLRHGRLIVLAGGLILLAYGLTFSARAEWDYVKSGMFRHTWSRYHLLPQLGVSLLVAAALPRLTPRGLWLLLFVLTLVHIPRGWFGTPLGWEQGPAFARLEAVDARCRELGISKAAAVAALPPWTDFPLGGEFNAWQLLRGSSTPRDLSPAEVRRLLDVEAARHQGHAHNDFQHARPLLDALDHGFASVEADVWLWEGKLLVGHLPWELRGERTLEALYLDPLRARQGPPVTLLVDVKTDARATYAALDGVLRRYAEMLSVTESGRCTEKAVTVIVSGNIDRATITAQEVRYAAIDGRPPDLDSLAPSHLIPWISADWAGQFRWRGDGPMPDDQRDRLRAFVRQAHARGRKVRFWGTPDKPEVWVELRAAGVDLLGTDDLAGLARYLHP